MNRSSKFIEALRQRVLIGDGAMGTELYARGAPPDVCYDQLNLQNPDLVRSVHAAYLAAGSNLIETNTFGANLPKLEGHGVADPVRDINARGVELARGAAGDGAFVAGSVGPLPTSPTDSQRTEYGDQEIRDIYREQIVALADAGADLLMLETFSDLRQIQLALEIATTCTDLPVMAQLVFHDPDRRFAGMDAAEALLGLARAGATVIGTNCGRGVQSVERIVESICSRTEAMVSAYPNAGFPENVDGRIMYLASPEYLADAADRMVQAGANVVGGCCGTGPATIAAIARRIGARRPAPRKIRVVPRAVPIDVPIRHAPRKTFLDRLELRRPILVELDPPYGLDYEKTLAACRHMKQLGVDAITMGDCPLATLRMSNIAFAQIVQRELHLETVVHYACRDRNLIGMQSELMGAWALGIRTILALTGDPAKLGNHAEAKSVYDLNSIGLLKLIAGLNQGRNVAGGDIKRATNFSVGVAFNPNFKNLTFEVNKLRRKVAAGAQFAMTQLIYDVDRMRQAWAVTRDLGIPIFPAVCPLVSQRNCEFLHNELPGCKIPEAIRQRMAGTDKVTGVKIGLAIARETIEQLWDFADGIYIVPPLNRAELAAELVAFVRDRLEAAERPAATTS